MKRSSIVSIAAAVAWFIAAPALRAQSAGARAQSGNSPDGSPGEAARVHESTAKTVPDSDKPFDHHDLSGVWRLAMEPRSSVPFRSTSPEPPLTDWGKAHLFPGGITHADKGNVAVDGGFAGQNCDPIGFPAQFAYLQYYPMEIFQGLGQIHQVFELHREWRDIQLGKEHPSDLSPTYMGDSVAKWDGDTLVVDTVGYNGKDWVTENVDHPMSDQFHLVERYTRLSYNTMKIEMTFYDPKFWGDQPWTGFTRTVKLQHDQLEEWICVPEVDAEYNQRILKPASTSKH